MRPPSPSLGDLPSSEPAVDLASLAVVAGFLQVVATLQSNAGGGGPVLTLMASESLSVEHGNHIKAWEPQQGESSLHFTYFAAYRDLGPQRSLEEAQKVLLKDDVIKRTPRLGTLRQLSSQNRWPYRAQLYDRDRFAQSQLEQAEVRREELRIGLENYQQFQRQMGEGLAKAALLRQLQGGVVAV